jgi:hypothetical protein
MVWEVSNCRRVSAVGKEAALHVAVRRGCMFTGRAADALECQHACATGQGYYVLDTAYVESVSGDQAAGAELCEKWRCYVAVQEVSPF